MSIFYIYITRIFYILYIYFIISISTLAAQSLYSIQYEFDTESGVEKYHSFMVLNDDGTGFLRLAFEDILTKQYNIIEYQVQELWIDTSRTPSDQIMYFTSDPIKIAGEISYPSDHYIFKKIENDTFYEPLYIVSYDETSQEENIGYFTSVELINETDLTEAFMSQFFLENEPLYQQLFNPEVRSLATSPNQTNLHLIVVANTLDKSIGKTCVVDKDNMLSLFKEIARFLDIGYKTYVIAGENFNRKSVDQTLSSIKPSTNDILIFYYTGHGYNDVNKNSQYPHLDLRANISDEIGGNNAMNIEEIYYLLKNKNARLNIILSDCCNNEINSSNNIGTEIAALRTSSIGWNKLNCTTLFLQSKASILMTASTKGQVSAGNVIDGGFFTHNFCENIEKSIGKLSLFKDANWNNIITQTQKNTEIRANKSLCRLPTEEVVRCAQKPIFNIN